MVSPSVDEPLPASPAKDDEREEALVVLDPNIGDMHPVVYEKLEQDVLALALFIRFLNTLLLATFFQPDEYFQSLEPAWEIAFGTEAGAWITWEWTHQLRSSLHPALFALVYSLPENSMKILSMFPQFRAMILVYLPRVVQGVFAGFGDYYTWKLAEKVYNRGSFSAWTALWMSFLSPWQWFCSTRTLSNSLETVLTIAALNFWPWSIAGDIDGPRNRLLFRSENPSTTESTKEAKVLPPVFQTAADVMNLRKCLILAGIASVLRPTNLLIWGSLILISVTRMGLNGSTRATTYDFFVLAREGLLCGGAVIALSAVSDKMYFGEWTFPPLQWLNFNIKQSLAVFYGTNDWHYYLSQGLPLLLTAYLPFGIWALWSSTSLSLENLPARIGNIRFQLAFMVITTISTLSRISHKEVRFIYPLLPILHVLAAPHLLAFLSSSSLHSTILNGSSKISISVKGWWYYLLIVGIITNVIIAAYVSQVHQRGVVDVMSVLRLEYEKLHLTERGELYPIHPDDKFGPEHVGGNPNETFAAFLMPCHSTPWRSHLVYPTLHAWALTCEPPINIPAGTPERLAYVDEAERFYNDPIGFLKNEISTNERPWPRFLVGFEGIEPYLQKYYEQEKPGFGVRRKWSGFNSHWHDDKRREGRVVIWESVNV